MYAARVANNEKRERTDLIRTAKSLSSRKTDTSTD